MGKDKDSSCKIVDKTEEVKINFTVYNRRNYDARNFTVLEKIFYSDKEHRLVAIANVILCIRDSFSSDFYITICEITGGKLE